MRLLSEIQPNSASGSSSREGGFTLIELLIAMTLLGFLAVLMFGALRFGTRAWERSETIVAAVDDVSVTQSLLRRLITDAYPMFIATDPTRPRIDFSGAASRVSLLAPMPDAIESGGLARFEVFAKERDKGDDMEIAWRPELARPGDPSATPVELPLLKGITRLEIAYFGARRPTDPPIWRNDWDGMTVMPQLVRVRVEFPAGDDRVWPDLIVAPKITVDESCVYDPVTRNCRGR